MIDEAPANCTPIEKNVCPIGALIDSGAYAVQPSANAPPGREEAAEHHQAGDRQQPERQRVQAERAVVLALPSRRLMVPGSFFAPGGAFADGWTAYAPLSSDGAGRTNVLLMAVQFAGASSIMTALNFLVTIITMRAPGMSFFRMPLLVWANFATSLLVVIATPLVAASQFFVRSSASSAATSTTQRRAAMADVAARVLVLLASGRVHHDPARHWDRGEKLAAFVPQADLRLQDDRVLDDRDRGLGFIVWAHHMFTSGMARVEPLPTVITTLIIAVPTGIKIFSWLATLWGGELHLGAAMMFALGFLTTFTLGGISGVMLASIPFDIHVTATYFVVGHIHYVLFGGSVLAIYAGLYYWCPKMTGRMYDERLGKWHVWMTFVAFSCTFVPMHWLGLHGMPRRVADYATKFSGLNLFISIARASRSG